MQKLKDILNFIPDGIMIMNTSTSKLAFYNNGLAKIISII